MKELNSRAEPEVLPCNLIYSILGGVTVTTGTSVKLWEGKIEFPQDLTPLLQLVSKPNLEALAKALARPPTPFVVRANPFRCSRSSLVKRFHRFQAKPVNWLSTPHAVGLPWAGPNNLLIPPDSKEVVADAFAAESVMVGSHLYTPGVLHTPKLKYNEKVVIVDPQGVAVALGMVKRDGGTEGFSKKEKGIFVVTTASLFTLPPLQALPEYSKNLFFSQSLPSMIAAQFAVVGAVKGDLILDLCAAPGGKTTYMAQLAPRAQFIAVDRSQNRLESLRNHVSSLHLDNIQVFPMTISSFVRTHSSLKVSRILLDPPCSALGLRPKLACRVTGKNVAALAKYQLNLTRTALSLLQSGGHLIYSTCTITPAENEDIINSIVETETLQPPTPLPVSNLKNSTVEVIMNQNPEGFYFRFDPVQHDTPGYFIAMLKKP